MSKYTIPSKLHANIIFGSETLKLPTLASNTGPQTCYPESGPQTRICSISTTRELVEKAESLALQDLLNQTLHFWEYPCRFIGTLNLEKCLCRLGFSSISVDIEHRITIVCVVGSGAFLCIVGV